MDEPVSNQPEIADVLMRVVGEGMETVIIEWLKNVGDTVTWDDALVEVESDKGVVEITADVPGVIQSIRFEAGTIVPAGEVIATIAVQYLVYPNENHMM